NGYAEALADPQTRHLQLVQPITLPGGHRTRTVACPVWLDGAPVPMATALPGLGEDTERLRAARGEVEHGRLRGRSHHSTIE
ncbi:MAG: CoA transferase, partial [Candidimonas sp.]